MELYQIRYFLAVADTLNFTRASQRSFVSQPAMSKAIQRLEESIGGRLFERSKSAVQLTDLGLRMLPSFRQIYDSAVQAREQARRLAKGDQERVRVGVMCTINLSQVLPGFADSQDSSYELDLSFHEGNLEALTNALDQGDLDLGIMCSPYPTPKRFAATTLFCEAYVLGIGDDHRFGGRTDIEMAELHRERYCERTMCEYASYIERLLDERGIDVQVVQQSSREDWIQALVRANFGVSFMPASIAQAAGLASVRISDVPIEREIRLLTQADRPINAAQQSVINALVGHTWGPGDCVGTPPALAA